MVDIKSRIRDFAVKYNSAGWDYHSAAPITEEIVRQALVVLPVFDGLDVKAGPSSGEVLFTWRSGNGNKILSSVYGDGFVHTFAKINGETFRINSEPISDHSRLREVVQMAKSTRALVCG